MQIYQLSYQSQQGLTRSCDDPAGDLLHGPLNWQSFRPEETSRRICSNLGAGLAEGRGSGGGWSASLANGERKRKQITAVVRWFI